VQSVLNSQQVLEIFAESNSSAPVSALVWWIIPIVALSGGLAYAYWVTRLKSKYDRNTARSVGRFRKFQDSFREDSAKHDSARHDSAKHDSAKHDSDKGDSLKDEKRDV
jgi:hypothetical protein